ncbi:Mov34/MPN/PAD-1 family protein [Terribacillus saccharophilus]|uniref:Mov34/MPN/PAD-1 family protein n=1 Tax=Terribacillus saccharophilus TaxID=361277 RepID=UPI003982C08C
MQRKYRLPNGKKLIIKNQPLVVFEQYKQIRGTDPESGGILIGRILVENGNYILDTVTEPMYDDKQTRYSFFRSYKGHNEYYEEYLKKMDYRSFYFGEWHTHPEADPTPSTVDKRDWERISKLQYDSQYLFFVIQGIQEIRIWCADLYNKQLTPLYEIK